MPCEDATFFLLLLLQLISVSIFIKLIPHQKNIRMMQFRSNHLIKISRHLTAVYDRIAVQSEFHICAPWNGAIKFYKIKFKSEWILLNFKSSKQFYINVCRCHVLHCSLFRREKRYDGKFLKRNCVTVTHFCVKSKKERESR